MTALIMESVIMESADAMWGSLVWIVLRTSVLETAVIMVLVTMKVGSVFAMKASLESFVRLKNVRMIVPRVGSVLMEDAFVILILLEKIVAKKFVRMIAIVS